MKTPEGWAKMRISALRSFAKREHLPFDLTTDDLLAAFPADGLCPYFKMPLVLGEGANPMNASVDKIIPAKGYVRGNIRVMSHRANTIKNDCTDPEVFRRIADDLEKDRVS